ncbi:MAG TPA: BrnT family toxin [Candidatus Acidoferrum sp.]|jgi:uncharacterized DUF497 family protein
MAGMIELNFEWDIRKARENRRKHRVTFPEAATIFSDPLAVTFADPDHSSEEERCLTVGQSVAGRILIVTHTDRDERMRIVSAREVTSYERKYYEEKE